MSEAFRTETREHRGYKTTIKWFYDSDMGPPWKEEDGHGVVSDWTARDKAPGELVLSSDRGSHKRFYDFAATVEIAKRDGWGLGDEEKAELEKKFGRAPTKNEIVTEAVWRNFKHLKDWCDNKWHWCGRTVEVEDSEGNDATDDYFPDSVWGFESTCIQDEEEEVFQNAEQFIDEQITKKKQEEFEGKLDPLLEILKWGLNEIEFQKNQPENCKSWVMGQSDMLAHIAACYLAQKFNIDGVPAADMADLLFDKPGDTREKLIEYIAEG